MQPFRFLYALAAEPRCVEAVDVETGQSVPLAVSIDLADGTVLEPTLPKLVPVPNVVELRSREAAYYPLSIPGAMLGSRVPVLKRPNRVPCDLLSIGLRVNEFHFCMQKRVDLVDLCTIHFTRNFVLAKAETES